MPYPVSPPEPPPLIRTLPSSEQTSAGKITALNELGQPSISPKVTSYATIRYSVPPEESNLGTADLLGSTVTLTEESQPYRFDSGLSFPFAQQSCLPETCREIAITPGNPQQPTVIPVPTPEDLVEITADRQEYDQQRQIVIAEGNVMVRFRQSLIEADQAQINLVNRQVTAEGNVALTRGNQVIRGDRMISIP